MWRSQGDVESPYSVRTIICYCAWWLAGGVLGLKRLRSTEYSADLLV